MVVNCYARVITIARETGVDGKMGVVILEIILMREEEILGDDVVV